MYVHVCMYVGLCMYVCMYVGLSMYVCRPMYMHTCIHAYACMYVYGGYVCTLYMYDFMMCRSILCVCL